MSWLNAAFQVAVPMLAGRAQGQVQGQMLARQLQFEDADRQAAAEQRRAQLAQAALQQQLLQAQIAHSQAEELRAQHPRAPWEQQGFGSQDEQLGYLEALNRAEHPERYQRPEQSTLTPWGKEGFPDEQSYLRYLGRAARAEHPERYEKPAGAAGSGSDLPFDPRDPKNHQKFLTAYLMRTAGTHPDPDTGLPKPAAPVAERLKDAEAAYQEMARLTDPDYNPADDLAPHEQDPHGSEGFTLPGMLQQMFGPSADTIGPVPSNLPAGTSAAPSEQAGPITAALGRLRGAEPQRNLQPLEADHAADAFTLPGLLRASGLGGDTAPAAGSMLDAAATRDPAQARALARIRELKGAGLGKEETYQQLLREGLIDRAGRPVTGAAGAP